MRINKINTVRKLILTSYDAGVSASNTAKLVKHTTDHEVLCEYYFREKNHYKTWESSEVLDDVFRVSIDARSGLNEKTYKFVKRVLASLENLYQNQ